MNPEFNPVTATGAFLDAWAHRYSNVRQAIRFKGLKFIWFFLFPLKAKAFEVPPPRGYYWESDAELRARILEILK